eukprot:scaffold437_cov111-Cylindrotheca_fusiformis.AAC.10
MKARGNKTSKKRRKRGINKPAQLLLFFVGCAALLFVIQSSISTTIYFPDQQEISTRQSSFTKKDDDATIRRGNGIDQNKTLNAHSKHQHQQREILSGRIAADRASNAQKVSVSSDSARKRHLLNMQKQGSKYGPNGTDGTVSISQQQSSSIVREEDNYVPFVPWIDSGDDDATKWEAFAASKPSSANGIPRRLIFSYDQDILQTKEPFYLYENLQKTIRVFAIGWDEPKPQVLFFDSTACRIYLRRIEPRLLLPFETEPFGPYQSDICRIVALYVHGGMYLDNDVEMLKAIVVPANLQRTDFITIDAPHKHRFTNSVIATIPKHPTLRAALDSMIEDWYFNPVPMAKYEITTFDPSIFYTEQYQKHLQLAIKDSLRAKTEVLAKKVSFHMGPLTLRLGYDRVATSHPWFLSEYDNGVQPRSRLYRHLYRSATSWGCNYLIHDQATRTAYAYSRCRGTSSCPLVKKRK